MLFKKRIDSSSVDVYESTHRFFFNLPFLWLEIVTEILESAQQPADSCEHTSLRIRRGVVELEGRICASGPMTGCKEDSVWKEAPGKL